ncbi:MAG: dephospho-CoA kinase [Thiotrichales bacterium]|nr:dephospho-CoA kinase [Thiotrichales bacterium]
MRQPLRIGLTGGIGSGKSTVSRIFQALHVPVIDADEIAHRLTKPGQAGFNEIINAFGKEVLISGRDLDRQKLRQLVFSEPDRKKKLESILHPLVYQEIDRSCKTLQSPYCLVVVPLLFESNGEDHVDRVLVIDCEEEEQLRRALERDQTSADDIRRIISGQTSREHRLSGADDVIQNTGDLSQLENEVRVLHEKYLGLAAKV